LYSVVDIETTGGTARAHRIIEIAIVNIINNQISDSYTTLINPQRYIPPFITSLTGISNEMVTNAPTFPEVADKIMEMMEGMVFVAHNVNFDYGFLRREFADIGIKLDKKKLCTVRLSKKIFPGFRSYGLGTLSNRLGISIEDRHRALGDAVATAKVMKLWIKSDSNDSALSRSGIISQIRFFYSALFCSKHQVVSFVKLCYRNKRRDLLLF
jgi:DNA polymerase-3 subunit epsilon